MKCILRPSIYLLALLLGGIYGVGSVSAATPAIRSTQPQKSIPTVTAEQSQKKKTMEEVNTLIIDSYRTRLDRVLEMLYTNIRIAARGNIDIQIDSLSQVQSDLDDKLDSINASEMSENRKKILLGVHFYLKSNIEEEIERLKGEKK